VDDLPRNASGKILKRPLRGRSANEVEGSAADKDTARTVEEVL
jgi:acyl-coenzyme A synthetase/AMP-(fatty) acid ligase